MLQHSMGLIGVLHAVSDEPEKMGARKNQA
jgi:hypothetical protein